MSAATNTQTVTKQRPMDSRSPRGRSNSRGNHANTRMVPNSHSGEAPPTMNLSELKKKDIASLIQIAKDYDIENANGMRLQPSVAPLCVSFRPGHVHDCSLEFQSEIMLYLSWELQ